MKEELIAFDTAKLAKEKGFNIPCNDFYDLYDNPNNKNLSYSLKDNWNDYKSYSAPTQSLLQKWLREHVEIEIYVRPSFKTLDKYIVCYMKWRDDRKFRQQYFIIPLNDNSVPEGTHQDFNSYEDALEAGLYEALKLIK